MKKIIYTLILISSANSVFSQITFQKTYGGAIDDYGYSSCQTNDGGYVITGIKNRFGIGGGDVYLIKTDIYGDTLWTKTFGGGSYDDGYCVQQTSDGGYIVVGSTLSFGTSGVDVYLIKTDGNGSHMWSKTFGGTEDDYGYFIQQTIDGGYIIAGSTENLSGPNRDIYLIKSDVNGNVLWSKIFGGTDTEDGWSVQQTSDGGYIITGFTGSYGAGNGDVFLIKTNPSGDTIWTKTYGGTEADHGHSVQQTSDGGYIIGGYTNSFGNGYEDIYIIKTNSIGDTAWTKTYGRTDSDFGFFIYQTMDGGYIISANNGDEYLTKTDSSGNILWSKLFGGIANDWGNAVRQTTDGGYVMIGYTHSFGAGNADVYLIKTDSNGNSGCNQNNLNLIINYTKTIVTNTAMQVFSGSIVGNPATQISSGGIVTTLCSTAGVNDLQNAKAEINISPNPASDFISITYQSKTKNPQFEIIDITGRKILSTQQKQIDVSKLPQGLYLLKVQDGELQFSKRFIKN